MLDWCHADVWLNPRYCQAANCHAAILPRWRSLMISISAVCCLHAPPSENSFLGGRSRSCFWRRSIWGKYNYDTSCFVMISQSEFDCQLLGPVLLLNYYCLFLLCACSPYIYLCLIKPNLTTDTPVVTWASFVSKLIQASNILHLDTALSSVYTSLHANSLPLPNWILNLRISAN